MQRASALPSSFVPENSRGTTSLMIPRSCHFLYFPRLATFYFCSPLRFFNDNYHCVYILLGARTRVSVCVCERDNCASSPNLLFWPRILEILAREKNLFALLAATITVFERFIDNLRFLLCEIFKNWKLRVSILCSSVSPFNSSRAKCRGWVAEFLFGYARTRVRTLNRRGSSEHCSVKWAEKQGLLGTRQGRTKWSKARWSVIVRRLSLNTSFSPSLHWRNE